MHHIIYLIWATVPFTDTQLEQVLVRARRRNTELAVTGVLFYGNGRFLQVLEGEREVVQEVYAHIRRDARHDNLLTFADKTVPQRAFADWAMAFHPVSAQQLAALIGHLGPTNVPMNTAGLAHSDQHLFDLLRAFVLP